MPDYEEVVQDFIEINGWEKILNIPDCENAIEMFMSRGIDRVEAEAYITMQANIAGYFQNNKIKKSFLKVQGLLITYGKK